MLTGRAGRRGGGGGAGPQPGEGGHGPGDGLARRRGLMRCGGRVCWANAELCAQSVGCSRKAVQGSRGCGACWAGERLRRAVRGLVGRELRCDVRCGLSRASAGCRGGGLRASCAWGCGILMQVTTSQPPHVLGEARRAHTAFARSACVSVVLSFGSRPLEVMRYRFLTRQLLLRGVCQKLAPASRSRARARWAGVGRDLRAFRCGERVRDAHKSAG